MQDSLGTEVVGKVAEQIPAIIKEAAQSPLGIVALLAILLSLVAFGLFRGGSERSRLAAFGGLLVGAILFGLAYASAAPAAPEVISIEARDVSRSVGVQLQGSGYGADVVQNATDAAQLNELEYTVVAQKGWRYELEGRLAAATGRPCTVIVNGTVVLSGVFGEVTGSWQEASAHWFRAGIVVLARGRNTITIRQAKAIPHFTRFRLTSEIGA